MDTHRVYELVSSRPLPALEIPVTVTQLWLGPHASERLIEWYTPRRRVLTWMSNAARICAVTCWFMPISVGRVLVLPLLCLGLPKLVCTMCMLSAPILQLLAKQYEFWFTTTLNVMCAVLFSLQLGADLRLGFAFLAFMSIQVTICSDADVYSVMETTRSGVLSIVCATALGVFAAHRNTQHNKLAASSTKDWQLAQVNLLFNASLTLAVFIASKSYKRRRLLLEELQGSIPLAVVRAKLAIQTRVPKDRPVGAPATAQEAQPLFEGPAGSVIPATLPASTASSDYRRRSSSLISSGVLPFLVPPLWRKAIRPAKTLAPKLSLKKPLANWQLVVLTACGMLGLGAAGIGLLLIIIIDVRARAVLYPIAVSSLILTAAFCITHAVHYQRDLVRLVTHNFDFWFTSTQFITATICLADLLQWDYRCLTIISWSFWFHWVLLTDAMLSVHKRRLRFKKKYATVVLLAVLFGILVLAYSLAIDKRDILRDRELDFKWISGAVPLTITTANFMAYRLVTIWLWTVRLVARLARYTEDELILLRGAVEYQNPFQQLQPNRT